MFGTTPTTVTQRQPRAVVRPGNDRIRCDGSLDIAQRVGKRFAALELRERLRARLDRWRAAR